MDRQFLLAAIVILIFRRFSRSKGNDRAAPISPIFISDRRRFDSVSSGFRGKERNFLLESCFCESAAILWRIISIPLIPPFPGTRRGVVTQPLIDDRGLFLYDCCISSVTFLCSKSTRKSREQKAPSRCELFYFCRLKWRLISCKFRSEGIGLAFDCLL